MPYKSQAQAAFMHIHHPGIAKRWDKKYGETGPLPKHVKGGKKRSFGFGKKRA